MYDGSLPVPISLSMTTLTKLDNSVFSQSVFDYVSDICSNNTGHLSAYMATQKVRIIEQKCGKASEYVQEYNTWLHLCHFIGTVYSMQCSLCSVSNTGILSPLVRWQDNHLFTDTAQLGVTLEKP